MTNFDLSLKVFSFLKEAQVQSVVVCAGARNAPLVMALKEQNFKIYSFFEERSAAFFAIGLMRGQNAPVAVITTSGTAVAELLPAAIESTYQGLPLILVTADRPKSYRGTGSPQTIEQVGLFSKYVEATHDLDVTTEKFEFNWSFKKPIHLNICFDEPLIDRASENITTSVLNRTSVAANQYTLPNVTKRPLVVLGGLENSQIDEVVQFILKTKAPVYAESLSQLSHHEKLAPFLIRSSDLVIKKLFQKNICDSVIRIGTVPTLRFWRDLESEFKQTPVVQFTELKFSGLARETSLHSFSQLKELNLSVDANYLSEAKKIDEQLQSKKLNILEKYPLSEPALVAGFSDVIRNQALYLGNSLPIRHWDQFAKSASAAIYANRGANGIDGQISTYLGWAESFAQSFCLVGDLTAMYDLTSLALTNQLRASKKRVVIINNFGGQIFNRVFKNDLFINAHQTQFKHWAAMWSWDYQLVKSTKDFVSISSEHVVVEIQPDVAQTKLFWDEWDDVCRKA